MYILSCSNCSYKNNLNYTKIIFKNKNENIVEDIIKNFFDYYVFVKKKLTKHFSVHDYSLLTIEEKKSCIDKNFQKKISQEENKEINIIIDNIYEHFTSNIPKSGSIDYKPQGYYEYDQMSFNTKEIIIEFLNYIIYFSKFPKSEQFEDLQKILYLVFHFPRIKSLDISEISENRNFKKKLEFIQKICKSIGEIICHIYNFNNSSYRIIQNFRKKNQKIDDFYNKKIMDQFYLDLQKIPFLLDLSKIPPILLISKSNTLQKIFIILGFFLSAFCFILYFIFINNSLILYIIFSIYLILLIFLGYQGYNISGI